MDSLNWTVPLSGHLMGISTTADFSLEFNKPKDGFMHIRHPKSFRACLLQVEQLANIFKQTGVTYLHTEFSSHNLP